MVSLPILKFDPVAWRPISEPYCLTIMKVKCRKGWCDWKTNGTIRRHKQGMPSSAAEPNWNYLNASTTIQARPISSVLAMHQLSKQTQRALVSGQRSESRSFVSEMCFQVNPAPFLTRKSLCICWVCHSELIAACFPSLSQGATANVAFAHTQGCWCLSNWHMWGPLVCTPMNSTFNFFASTRGRGPDTISIAVQSVFCWRHVFQIMKRIVALVSIFVVDLNSLWTWGFSKKCPGN